MYRCRNVLPKWIASRQNDFVFSSVYMYCCSHINTTTVCIYMYRKQHIKSVIIKLYQLNYLYPIISIMWRQSMSLDGSWRNGFYLKLPLYFKIVFPAKVKVNVWKIVFPWISYWMISLSCIYVICFLTIRCSSLIKTYVSKPIVALICNHQYHPFMFYTLKQPFKHYAYFYNIFSCIRLTQIMIHNILGNTWFSRGDRLGFF